MTEEKGETETSSGGESNPPTWLEEWGIVRGTRGGSGNQQGVGCSQRKLQTWQRPQKSFPAGHEHS